MRATGFAVAWAPSESLSARASLYDEIEEQEAKAHAEEYTGRLSRIVVDVPLPEPERAYEGRVSE